MENENGAACGICGRERHTTYFEGKPEANISLGKSRRRRGIILKCVLKKQDGLE
jgi:hypothetical protein